MPVRQAENSPVGENDVIFIRSATTCSIQPGSINLLIIRNEEELFKAPYPKPVALN